MHQVRRFLALPFSRQALLLRAALVVTLATILCRIIPFRFLRGYLFRNLRVVAAETSDTTIEQIIWAVEAVARRIPGAMCLPQAIAARAMLARVGCASKLRVGVGKAGQRGFMAHAWLEKEGKVLIGYNSAMHSDPFPALF